MGWAPGQEGLACGGYGVQSLGRGLVSPSPGDLSGKEDRPSMDVDLCPLGSSTGRSSCFRACPCPQGVPSLRVRLAEGPGGCSPRCTGLRVECRPPPPWLHQQKAPQRLPVVGPDQVVLSHSPAASSLAVRLLWPHPLRPPILRAWSRMGKQLAGATPMLHPCCKGCWP